MAAEKEGAVPQAAEAGELLVLYFRFFRRILGLDEALGGLDLLEEEMARLLKGVAPGEEAGEEVSSRGVPQGREPEGLHLYV